MGNNTVAFLLNDNLHRLSQSPHTALWLLTTPIANQERRDSRLEHMRSVAAQHNEPPLFEQDLEVLPYFHSSEEHYYVAGGNRIQELEVLRSGTATVNTDPRTGKGTKVRTITLILGPVKDLGR